MSVVALLISVPGISDAQVGSIRRRAEEAAKKKLEEAAKKSSADSAKAKAAADSAKADSVKAAPAGGAAAKADAPAAAGRSDPKVWENYDFIPGSKVIFFTDFSEDRVGNFSRRLKYVSGPIEVVERDGAKVLRSTGRSTFLIPLGKKLPQKFTLEIDIVAPTAAGCCGYEVITFEGGATMDRGEQSVDVNWNASGALMSALVAMVGTAVCNSPRRCKRSSWETSRTFGC